MAQQISGGYNFVTKGSVNDHSCPICLSLIQNTVELPCTHIACEGCLLRSERSRFPSKCPKCRNPYNENQKQRVRSTDRFIRNSIDVECKQTKDGCKWVGCIGDYEDSHSARCEFVMVTCCNVGCRERHQRRNFQEHWQICEWRTVRCLYCKDLMNNSVLKEHLKVCPMHPVQCTNTNCNKRVKRHELEKHCKETCNFQTVVCPYHRIGCHAQMNNFFCLNCYKLKDCAFQTLDKLLRGNMTTHCRNHNDHHTMLLMQNHITLSMKNSELEKKNTELESKLTTSGQTIAGLEEKVIKSDKMIVGLEEKVIKSDKAIAGLEKSVTKSDVLNSALEYDLNCLTDKYSRMENELKKSENAIDQLRVESVLLKSDHEDMETKLINSERAIEEMQKNVDGWAVDEGSNKENVKSTTLGEVNEISGDLEDKAMKRRHTLDSMSSQVTCTKKIRF